MADKKQEGPDLSTVRIMTKDGVMQNVSVQNSAKFSYTPPSASDVKGVDKSLSNDWVIDTRCPPWWKRWLWQSCRWFLPK